MDKIILASINELTVFDVDKVIRLLKDQNISSPYTVRLGPNVKLGPGVHKYLRDKEVNMI